MSASCGGKKGACQIVVGLLPGHLDEVVKDPRFKPYARARDAVSIDVADIDDWKPVAALVRESYDVVRLAKSKKKKTVSRRSSSGRARTR